MMPTLHVHLLGDFHLILDAKPITSVIPPRVQLLLAYLVLHCQTPLSRQRLAFLFWPDSSEDQARNNLRQSLHLLKQTLPHSERFLQSDGQPVHWLPDSPFTLDVASFEKTVEQADTIDALRQVVSLYHGDLLEDCYDEWVLSERERLRQHFVEALERLVGSLENERDYHSTIGYVEYLLRFTLFARAGQASARVSFLVLPTNRRGGMRVKIGLCDTIQAKCISRCDNAHL